MRMAKTIDEILALKPEARPRIYAYTIADDAHAGLLKIGQSTRDVKRRVAEQLMTAAIKNYRIELDEPAERDDGTVFTDHEVRAALSRALPGYCESFDGVPKPFGVGASRSAMWVHRASGATYPNGLGTPPKAAHQGPVAALRFLDDVPHRPAEPRLPTGPW